MRRWSRSLVLLGLTFASTLAITAGLVVIVVQDRGTSFESASETPLPTVAVDGVPAGTGGTLAVSGDRDATFGLDGDDYGITVSPDFERGFARVAFETYELRGDAGTIRFAAEPLVVEQIAFDGLSFYPDPEDCAVTPGELNPAIGVASARLECRGLEDIRGGGTVAMDGAVALPADLLGMRGDLPAPGGRIDAGDATLVFSDGRMLVQNATMETTGREPLFLFGDDERSSLGFERDPETGDLFLTYLVIDEEPFDIPDDACGLTTEDLGLVNPRTTATRLSIACDELDLGSHGVVPVEGTIVIDLIVPSDLVARR